VAGEVAAVAALLRLQVQRRVLGDEEADVGDVNAELPVAGVFAAAEADGVVVSLASSGSIVQMISSVMSRRVSRSASASNVSSA